jgi:hypothetical protein
VRGAQVNFINHFSGCQLCTQQNKEGDYAVCESEFVKSYDFASAAFGKLLSRAPPRNISLDMQLAATPYCQARALLWRCFLLLRCSHFACVYMCAHAWAAPHALLPGVCPPT